MVDRALAVMVVGYLVGLGMLFNELRHSPTVPATTEAPSTESLPPLELPPNEIKSVAVYDGITERPLFNPERRPQSSDTLQRLPESRTLPVDQIDGYRLAAVLRGLGSATALIEDPSGDTRTLHSGERMGKWKLQEILDDRVVLQSGDRRETLLVHRFDPVVVKKAVPGRSRSGPRTENRRPAQTLKRPPARAPARPPQQP